MRSAWLVIRLRHGHPYDVRVFSEWPITLLQGMSAHCVAKARGRDLAEAKMRVERWWRNRRSWQKRALLSNALVSGWVPPEI